MNEGERANNKTKYEPEKNTNEKVLDLQTHVY